MNEQCLVLTSDALTTRHRHSELAYIERALVHPVNLLMLTVSTLVGLLSRSPWIGLLAAGVAEAIMFGVIRRTALFRDSVAADLEREERRALDNERAQILSQLATAHRDQFERLAKQAEAIEQRTRTSGEAAALAERLDVQELLAAYLRLATEHDHCRRELANVHLSSLVMELTSLSDGPGEPEEFPQLRSLREARRALLQKRIERARDNERRLQAIEHYLAIIADAVLLLHGCAFAPRANADNVEQAAQLLASVTEVEQGVREAELLVS